jgi:putative oxidoreductase
MEILPSIPNGAAYAFWLLRVILGVVFFAHGAQKVFGWFGGHGLKATGDMFATYLRIPRPLFYLSAFGELLGGLFVIIGIFPRLVSLGLAVMMLVAIIKVHRKAGFFLSTSPEKPNGYEYNLALIAMSLAVAVGL